MKNRTVLFIVSVNLFILLLLAIFYPQQMISPGNPVEAHRETGEDCFSCHTLFFGSTADKCVACHEVSEIGLKTTTGIPIAKEKKNVAFHQSLREEDCVACHSEHKGVQPFRPIGRFSHELLASDIQDQCDSCHGKPGDNLHRKLKGNCNACHTRESWKLATFDHDKYFRFDLHHDTDCVTCHTDNIYEAYTCYGCHEHSRSNIREEHLEEGIVDYENCVECHRSGDEDEAEDLWRSRQLNSDGKTQRDYPYESDDDDDDD